MAAKKKKGGEELLTLTEVSNRTGISMPTLQRYKKLYQARIPSEGQGRKQRYPEAALAVFEEIKQENIGRRGRPRKDANAGSEKPSRAPRGRKKAKKKPATKRSSSKKASSQPADTSGLLTLAEIGRRTGISYPTLSRYVKQYSERLKSEGKGRARRFYEEAVSVFEEIRSRSGRGRKAGTAAKGRKASKGGKAPARGRRTKTAASAGDAELTQRVAALEKQLKALERKLSKPVRFKVLSS